MLKRRFIFVTLPLCLLSILLGSHLLFPKPVQPPQVYDCFLFFNEIELLKIRLKEMSPHVDHFVIVEATQTFRGKKKPLNFQENSHLFEEFKEKIIYIPLTEQFETESAWERERFQRAQVMRGLKKCHNSDIILLSDLDEIVRSSSIAEITSLLTSKKTQAVVCEQQMYYGYLNRYWGVWPGTVATNYKQCKALSIKKMRKLRNQRPRSLRRMGIKRVTLLKNAGWHFTSMGGVERCIQKVQAYSHSEFDRPELKTEEYFKKSVEEKALVAIDASFPAYIQENFSHFEQIGFIDKPQQEAL